MSVFEGGNNQSTEAGTTTTEENQSFVSELVKARGDQWSDIEVIAKGKIEADKHIEQLRQELAELQGKVTKESRLEELIAKIEQKAATTTDANAQSSTEGSANESNTKTSVGEDQIQSLIEQTLSKKERDNVVKQNLEQVNSQLASLFGTEAKEAVQKKAKELNLSVERLEEIATESPSAFFSLIGEKPKDFKPMTNSSINTEGVNMQGSQERNNRFYQELRKKDPRKFNKLNGQMVEDRIKLGDNFYK